MVTLEDGTVPLNEISLLRFQVSLCFRLAWTLALPPSLRTEKANGEGEGQEMLGSGSVGQRGPVVVLLSCATLAPHPPSPHPRPHACQDQHLMAGSHAAWEEELFSLYSERFCRDQHFHPRAWAVTSS